MQTKNIKDSVHQHLVLAAALSAISAVRVVNTASTAPLAGLPGPSTSQELPRQILQQVAATLKMVVEKKKFEKRSKIPPLENPFRTGHFLDVVAYPEISESGNFFESSFYYSSPRLGEYISIYIFYRIFRNCQTRVIFAFLQIYILYNFTDLKMTKNDFVCFVINA